MSVNNVPTHDSPQKGVCHKFPSLIRKEGDTDKYYSAQGTTKGKCHFIDDELDDVLWEIAWKEWNGKCVLGGKC
jgi:hypothetical protein